MKWFRFYSEALHDPKVQRLPPPLFKHWVNLLCLANETNPRGTLPSIEDIAFALRIPAAAAKRIVADLHAAGLLDTGESGTEAPHNWAERQRNSDDVAARVRRYRNGTADEPQPPKKRVDMLPVTLPSTEHVTLQVTGSQQECINLERDIDQIRIDQTQRERVNHIPADAPTHAPGAAITKQARLPPRIPELPLPDPYPLTPEMQDWASRRVPTLADISTEHDQFCRWYHGRENERRTNWRPVWEKWMVDAVTRFKDKGASHGTPYESRAERNERYLHAHISRWTAPDGGDADHEGPARLPA